MTYIHYWLCNSQKNYFDRPREVVFENPNYTKVLIFWPQYMSPGPERRSLTTLDKNRIEKKDEGKEALSA